jgi:tetratricopeptide (TPR) repeat protein
MRSNFSRPNNKTIKKLGGLIDISTDLRKEEGFKYAIEQASKLLSAKVNDWQKGVLHYFIANAWEGLRVLKHSTIKATWTWHQEEIEKAILNYRLCNKYLKNCNDQSYLCLSNTNLGNVFNTLGRFVEAIEFWNKTLALKDSFSMAMINKAYGLVTYSRSLYDEGHQAILLKYAYKLLKQGLKGNDIYHTARKFFENLAANIEAGFKKEYLQSEFKLKEFPLGKTIAENDYRKWCLQNYLFLNPLNDLGPFSIAARDILHCPSITTTISEHDSPNPPVYFTFYNQLKQEYVSARFLLYECLKSNKSHFSDRDVLIYNTLDYSCFGLNVEQAKISFRMIYSLFDKIGFFLNCYLKLQVPDRNIAFKTIWYNNQRRGEGLHRIFSQMRNWPFRGLFWLAKDLSEQGTKFADSIEPDAQDLVTIRNSIEHKFLTLHQMDLVNFIEPEIKHVTYPVYFQDFANKTLRLMKLARAALIYLSLGVHIEEKKRHTNGESQIIGQMPLTAWEDSWKTHF